MIDADADRRAGLGRRDLRRCEIEAQEMHSRGFFVVAARQIFVREREQRRRIAHLHPHAVFEADHRRERRTALGDVGSQKAIAVIARQMQKLLASDVLYATVVRPKINDVLAANGIEGSDVPPSIYLQGGTEWLDEATVSAALGSVSGSTAAATSGIHGLGLFGTSVNGTELTAESTTSVSSEGTPEVEVQVQNQGGSTENGVTVSVTVSGGATLQGTIETIGAGETESALIPLTPAPKGEVTLEVDVETVPGEQISTNNKASYTVAFE